MLVKSPVHHTTTDALHKLIQQYHFDKTPIEVNFRKLVHWIPYNSDRYTHLLHHYPAKLIPQIPHFFINNELLSSKGDTVLDPFCGTGTVMVEAIVLGRNGIGADSNPLARLIAKSKCTQIDAKVARKWQSGLQEVFRNTSHFTIPPVVNLEYWFSERIIDELGRLLSVISHIQTPELRNLALVTFSHTLRDVSLADPRISVPVRLNPSRFHTSHYLHKKAKNRLDGLKRLSVLERFEEVFDFNLKRISNLSNNTQLGTLRGIASDARCLAIGASPRRIRSETIQLAVTSPPYLGAQKYVRASSLSLGWLNLVEPSDLTAIEATSIGREHFPKAEYSRLTKTGMRAADALLKNVFKKYPLRAQIASTYLLEMKASIQETHRTLKQGGYFALVAGANRLCGEDFNTPDYLRRIAESAGFKTKLVLVDTIQSRGLMTKRNRTAGLIPQEWVFLFQRQ